MSLVLGLTALALVLIFFEVLLPGGILGLLAAICIIAATVIAGDEYGWVTAAVVLIGSLLACLILTIIEFKIFAKTKYGSRFFLKDSVRGHTRGVGEEAASLIGKQGLARTRLNPSGKVAIDNIDYEAHSQDGYLDANTKVEVIGKDNFKLIIKKL